MIVPKSQGKWTLSIRNRLPAGLSGQPPGARNKSAMSLAALTSEAFGVTPKALKVVSSCSCGVCKSDDKVWGL